MDSGTVLGTVAMDGRPEFAVAVLDSRTLTVKEIWPLASCEEPSGMSLDFKTHRVFLVSAEFGPAPTPTAEKPHPRPIMVPGTFTLLVYGLQASGPQK